MLTNKRTHNLHPSTDAGATALARALTPQMGEAASSCPSLQSLDLTDTGASCDRQGAAAYMRLGRLVAEVPHKIKCLDPDWCTSEDLLKCGLTWHSVQILSVQPLFYLSCKPTESHGEVASNFSHQNRRKLTQTTGCSLVREHAIRQNYMAEFEAAQKLSQRVASEGWERTDWGCPRSLSIPAAEHSKSNFLPVAETCPKLLDPNTSLVLSTGSVAMAALLSTTIVMLAARLVGRTGRYHSSHCRLSRKK